MKLKNRFFLVFLLISTIPVIIITSFTYDRYTKLIKERTSETAANVFEKATLEANSSLDNIKHISVIFNFYSGDDNSIVDDLKKYSGSSDGYTNYDVFQSNENIRFICKNLIFSSDYLNGIYIFTPSGETLGYGYGIDLMPNYTPLHDKWYQNTLDLAGEYYVDGVSEKSFIINSDASVSFSQALYDVYTHEFLGVLFIDCSPKIFDLSNINTMPETAMLAVVKKNGPVLYSNIDSIKSDISFKTSQTYTTALSTGDLELVFSVNYEDLYREFGVTAILILAIALLCAAIAIILSLVLSSYLTRPIVHLSKKMAIKSGKNLETSTKYLERTDEIGVLYTEYNQMIETLSEYIQIELKNKLITLDSQMKSLEAQINSHFLYNTLESINSIAEIEGVDSISTISIALGDMFRYSIKTQSELVTVQDEVNHMMKYISIQEIRFNNAFSTEIHIPKEHYSLKVLKLILQPLVENALYHGLQYCHSGDRIILTCRTEQQNIIFEIEDNGVGVEPQTLRDIQKHLDSKAEFSELGQRNKESIGLKNIHTRLVLYYGEGYGLSITSQLGKGTKITIKIPIV
ncbi:MAG: sensor histidine kinase [Lachnospiraceae bacterium]